MTPAIVLAEQTHIPILLIVGCALFFGTIGARVFQWLRIPQVVGYIAIGLAVGRTGLNLINEEVIANLRPFSFFALGIIGFMIGGELHRDVFKKYGRQFISILFAEGLGAFIIVSILVGGVAMITTGNVKLSIALGIVLGAISSATAPAATVDVLWEYKTRGVLTTAVFAMVALDDGLALVLYGLTSSIASGLLGSDGGGGITAALAHTVWNLGGGVAVGAAAGVALNFILRRSSDHAKSLTFILGSMALVIGVAMLIDVDVILSAMALGVTISNLAPRRSNTAFQTVETFAPPIYVLFFVIVGARLNVSGMASWMCWLALAYVVGRTAGKMIGANLGARWAGAPVVLRKYLGMCLFSQAGVAVGLSIVASETFGQFEQMGTAIIMIVAATTFIVQIIGPPSVKLAVKKAGEIGLNVTEDDLLASYKVADMVDRSSPAFSESVPLASILRTIAATDAMNYPVVDAEERLVGVITLGGLKQSFSADGLAAWLVAFDLMQPVPETVTENTPLAKAVAMMRAADLDYLPVVAGTDDPKLVGMLELRAVNRKLSHEILRRHQLADGVSA